MTLSEKEEARELYEKAIKDMQDEYDMSRQGAIGHLAGWGVYPPDAEPADE